MPIANTFLSEKKKQIIIVAYSPTCSKLLEWQIQAGLFGVFQNVSPSFVFLLNRLNPTNLYRAEFDILFPFLPFGLFLRLCVHSCVCECIHRDILYFNFPHLSHGSQLPISLHNFGYKTSSEKTIREESNGRFCSLFFRFWRLAGCGVLPCLAVSIRTKRALIHCTATATSGGLILQWCLRRSSAAFPTAERMDRVRSSNFDP